MALIFSLVAILCLYALYHYWNIGVAVAGLIHIVDRIPDLLIEIKTGKKINKNRMSKGPIDIFLLILNWLTIPLLWYSFYILS